MIQTDPDLETAAARLAAGEPALVSATRIDDLETPVSAYLKLAARETESFLLESVEGGAYRGRYSAIGFDPDLIWRCAGGSAEIAEAESGDARPDVFQPTGEDPITSLKTVMAASRLDMPEALAPISAGLFGYLGFDMARYAERLPERAGADPLGTPEAMLIRPRVVLVFDALRGEITAAAPVRPVQGGDPHILAEAAARRIEAAFDRLDGPAPIRRQGEPWAEPVQPVANMSENDYRAIVERAKAYTRAGDIFQVVPSQRFSAPFAAPPTALYRSLRRTNPSPFMFLFDFIDFSVVGSSPEILVRVRDGKVTVRPLAGTRPRGATPAEDHANEASLLADPKEQAEHLMLLDLGRNDVGRVAAPGSVRVTEQAVVERYSHVMHIQSTVEGDLDPACDGADALLAGFPAGTVSGAPKVRAMEIIDELEPHRRGVYAGAAGYLGASGEIDTCITLRTAIVKDGVMHVQAGAGVVLDSDPEAERQETVNKAAALFRAASEAWRFL